jgi:hypothetical protein
MDAEYIKYLNNKYLEMYMHAVLLLYEGQWLLAKSTFTHLTLSECWGQFADICIVRGGECEEFGVAILMIITAPGVICCWEYSG